MKKNVVIAAFIVALIATLSEASIASLGSANPVGMVVPIPNIFLLSPKMGLYNENTITLSFCGQATTWAIIEYSQVKYWLDGKLLGQLDILTSRKASEAFTVNLTGLSDGQHIVEVTGKVTVKEKLIFYADNIWGDSALVSSGKVNFTIDTTSPHISILTLQNQSFREINVSLNLTVNEPVSWIGYSLDGKPNATITDSTLLTHPYGIDNYYFALNILPEGTHNLIAYVKDPAGNLGASETFTFTIITHATSTPSQSPQSSQSNSSTQLPTAMPSNTPNPTSSLTPSSSEQPTTTPSKQLTSPTPSNQPKPAPFQTEITYTSAAAVVILVIIAVVFMFRKKNSPQFLHR